MSQLKTDRLSVDSRRDERGIVITSPVWEGFRIGPLTPQLQVGGDWLEAVSCDLETGSGTSGNSWLKVRTRFAPAAMQLSQTLTRLGNGMVQLSSELSNDTGRAVCLNRVRLLTLDKPSGEACFGKSPESVRVYEQGNHWTRVRRLTQAADSKEPTGEAGALLPSRGASQLCWVAYDAAAHQALLIGFETSERWIGQIVTESNRDGGVTDWSIEFDAGDVRLEAASRTDLEEVLFNAGEEPYSLLEGYAVHVKERHRVKIVANPVSWCSWYPYRLGVSEARVLANARVAAERLKPLGFQYMLIDLGWERDYVPCVYEENDQFPNGLGGLAEKLDALGLKLGAWAGPVTIHEHSAVAQEHPGWLLGSKDAKPLSEYGWTWQPHGKIYNLDLTHPEARTWLRERIRSLAQRGVRYLKPDFFGGVMSEALRVRHDPMMVAGGGCEAARLGMQILMDEMRSADAEALVMNCGAPELPGKAAVPLIYTCADTGNTGYVGWQHLREDLGKNLAGHLFKQGRWGVLQPSCLCVGLPGTLEEARLRATAAFMTGGQIDISDDLTTLPEDRWEVLTATLPTPARPARPIDLFDPISVTSLSYEAVCRGDDIQGMGLAFREESCVWHLPIEGAWDRWDLVALFNYEQPTKGATGGADLITRFEIPLERLGLDPTVTYWAYEFWSRQYLGAIPVPELSPDDGPAGYTHPGDARTLIATRSPGVLEVAFFGPGVKLLILRPARSHPWVIGTSFHQSGGSELEEVDYDASEGRLRGKLHRPAGQQGCIVVASCARTAAGAAIAGRKAALSIGANGSVVLPVVTETEVTTWEIRFAPEGKGTRS